MGVWSCQGLYRGVVMSRTVWGCGHVKDCMGCGHVKDCMGVWSCQGLYGGVVMSRADRMSMVSTWPWTVSSLYVLGKNPFNNIIGMI